MYRPGSTERSKFSREPQSRKGPERPPSPALCSMLVRPRASLASTWRPPATRSPPHNLPRQPSPLNHPYFCSVGKGEEGGEVVGLRELGLEGGRWQKADSLENSRALRRVSLTEE